MSRDLITVAIRNETDIVHSRSIARTVAEMAGFSPQGCTAVATSVSEIARNAWVYGGGGSIRFEIVSDGVTDLLRIVVVDNGPGIGNLQEIMDGEYVSKTGMGIGLIGARRLMERFEITPTPGGGTTVTMARRLPPGHPAIRPADLKQTVEAEERRETARNSVVEVQHQNRELMSVLQELQARQEDLNRLNQELEDTNRGVVALYAELDERANSLRQANDLKTRFLSHMSHEFRTPLNSIAALSRLLLERADGPLTTDQEIQIEFIRRAADELTNLVNDLLDLAKVEAGKVEVYPTGFEVAELFGSLRGMLRPLVVNDAVELHFDVGNVREPMVTDEAKVAQILRNFISNALKFTERGEVRVTARNAPGGMVVFSVKDTGIGIAAGDRERIFQEFTQVDSTLQKSVKGTGLGLPLSRQLARLLRGDITVESIPGEGSTFSLTIPAIYRGEQTAGSAGPRPSGIMGQGESVLVIDDDNMVRYLFRQLLSTTGYQIIEAADGATGLEVARNQRPALIILDKMMPGIDGIDVLRELRRGPETERIPVIFSTSIELDMDDRRAIEQAGAMILSKDLLTRARVLEAITLLKEQE